MDIREHLGSFFPDIIFFDSPVTDDCIIGLSLVYDDGPSWVVTYEEDKTIEAISKSFDDIEDPYESAVEWYDFNVLGSYVGHCTPVFMNDSFNTAVRFHTYYENVYPIEHFEDMQQALDAVVNDNEAMVFVQLSKIDTLAELV
jgi:hypothetical protein